MPVKLFRGISDSFLPVGALVFFLLFATCFLCFFAFNVFARFILVVIRRSGYISSKF